MSEGASGLLAGAELRRLREENERLAKLGPLLATAVETLQKADDVGDKMETAVGLLTAEVERLRAERDRLRAVLAAVVEVNDSESATMDTHFEALEMARSVLADTARAGLEPTP